MAGSWRSSVPIFPRAPSNQRKKAIWPIAKAKEIPDKYLKRFMLKGTGEQKACMKAGPEIISIVRCQNLNLNAEHYPIPGIFDLIFCRNVMIYFDPQSRACVIDRLLRHLALTGYLFVGHAESLHGASAQLRHVIPTVYNHNSAPQKRRQPALAGGRNSITRWSRDLCMCWWLMISAVVREVMSAVLSRESGITVAVAADPFIAMTKIKQHRPDAIIFRSGNAAHGRAYFSKKIVREDPIPVVICSALTGPGTAVGIQALEEGAVEVVSQTASGCETVSP